jgi:hypothetical protein
MNIQLDIRRRKENESAVKVVLRQLGDGAARHEAEPLSEPAPFRAKIVFDVRGLNEFGVEVVRPIETPVELRIALQFD